VTHNIGMTRSLLAIALALPCLAAVPDVDKAKAMGSPTAPVTMEVFASFDCPHCKDLHDNTLPLIIRDFVVPGKLYLVFREFPLSPQYHPYAREAADYAVAAAKIGKYQPVAEALWRNQPTWAMNGKVWDTVASVLTPAEQRRVQTLAKEAAVTGEVQREYDEGVAAGINATPTVIVTQGAKRYPIPAQQLHYGFLKSLLDGMGK
jgi:protein-disulfide isomerase